MKNYSIDFHQYDKYAAIIYASSYISPFDSLYEITNDIKLKIENAGYILFDLLLTNGDSFNRFAEAYYDGYEIRESSIKVISLKVPDDLKYINAHYFGRAKELNNSVLPPTERIKYMNF